jgi:hypothetical protein
MQEKMFHKRMELDDFALSVGLLMLAGAGFRMSANIWP